MKHLQAILNKAFIYNVIPTKAIHFQELLNKSLSYLPVEMISSIMASRLKLFLFLLKKSVMKKWNALERFRITLLCKRHANIFYRVQERQSFFWINGKVEKIIRISLNFTRNTIVEGVERILKAVFDLCSPRWLKPSVSSDISFFPSGLRQLSMLLGDLIRKWSNK